jgi:hypothetical protein
MMQMSFAPSDRLRASRVRAALACALELHNADPAASACGSSAASLDHMDWEIGSLPINALAIAIALTGKDLWTGTLIERAFAPVLEQKAGRPGSAGESAP